MKRIEPGDDYPEVRNGDVLLEEGPNGIHTASIRAVRYFLGANESERVRAGWGEYDLESVREEVVAEMEDCPPSPLADRE